MDRATDDTLQAWLKIANNIIEILKKKIVTFQVNMFFFGIFASKVFSFAAKTFNSFVPEEPEILLINSIFHNILPSALFYPYLFCPV